MALEIDDVIFIKFYENGSLLDGSYFQRQTRATALFEFIGRQDVYLEGPTISLSPECSHKKLDEIFKNASDISLDIISDTEISDNDTRSKDLDNDLTRLTNMSNCHPTISCQQSRRNSLQSNESNDGIHAHEEVIVITDSPEKYYNSNAVNKSHGINSDTDISSPNDDLPTLEYKFRHSTKKHKQSRKSPSIESNNGMPTTEETIVITDSPEKDKYKCISSSSDDEPVTKRPRYQPYSGHNLDDDTVTEVVDKLPWNINGNCIFKIEYNKADGQRMKCSKDGRPWERYNNSYTKNFQKKRGTRLRARCKGSYQCNNTCCPFMKQYNMPNSMHIIKHDDISHCEECNSRMTFISCPAVKVWEFPKTSHLMTVFHTGIHTCYPIKNPDIPKSDLVDAMHLAPSSKPSEISNRLMMRKIQHSSSRKEVEDLAESLTDTRKARNLKQKILNSEPLSIKLANLQEKCLNQYEDPYLLFEYQIKEQKGEKWVITKSTIENEAIIRKVIETSHPENYQTYIFKSSREKVKILLQMMNEDHFIGEEWAFMDFKVNRVNLKGKHLKTFGISTYHTLLKNVTWLVRMDCEFENKNTVDMALSLVDKMVSSESGSGQTIFKPKAGFMLDEGGGMHSSLKNKYDDKYYNTNVVTCQFHLKQCAIRHASSAYMGQQDKNDMVQRFKKRINSLVYAETVNKYNKAFSDMEEFILCSGKTHLTKWLNWWDNRRNHVMEAFQPVSAPSTNLAEASHASMKLSGGTGLNIVQSAIYDISECFKFEKSIEGYCLGYVKSGTGPSKALKTSQMEKRTLKNIDELMTELDGQYHSGEQGPSRVTIASFQPNESSSHRADKGKDPDKRPEGRKRTVKSSSFNNSLEKASELGQFKIVDVEQYSPTEACVTVKTKDGDFYNVKFNQTTTCSCPYSKSQEIIRQKKYPCKHRLFVLLEIGFLHDDTVLLQYSYKSHEIRRIISKLRNHTEVSKDKSTNLLPHSNYESAKSSKELKLSMAKYSKDNLYEITFLSGLISKCYGCEKTFSPEDKNPPNDIVIRHLEIRPGYNREKNEWFVTKDKKQTNAYYHAKAQCVKTIHGEFIPDLVVLPHSIKLQLSDDHKEKLQSSGFII